MRVRVGRGKRCWVDAAVRQADLHRLRSMAGHGLQCRCNLLKPRFSWWSLTLGSNAAVTPGVTKSIAICDPWAGKGGHKAYLKMGPPSALRERQDTILMRLIAVNLDQVDYGAR